MRGLSLTVSLPVQIPADAWNMDFVLSDAPEGASFFDNNGGMDYHVDVTDSREAAPPLNVFHVAVEMAPIAKVRGPSNSNSSFQSVVCVVLESAPIVMLHSLPPHFCSICQKHSMLAASSRC